MYVSYDYTVLLEVLFILFEHIHLELSLSHYVQYRQDLFSKQQQFSFLNNNNNSGSSSVGDGDGGYIIEIFTRFP